MALPRGNGGSTIACAARDVRPASMLATPAPARSTFAVFRPKARTWYRTGIRTASTNGRNRGFVGAQPAQ